MSRIAPALAMAVLVGLYGGCEPAAPPTGSDGAPLLPVTDVATVELDAVLPSDVLWLPDGGLLVLDGYQGRILRYGSDGVPQGVWTAPQGIGRAVRLSPSVDDGVWAVVPGDDLVPGTLLHLGVDGAVEAVVAPQAADGTSIHPVDVVDLGATLLIAERSGALTWLHRATGVATRILDRGIDKTPLRRIVDLVAGPEGTTLLVDTLAPRVRRLNAAGEVDGGFSRRGLAAGQLFRPTSVALVPGGMLIADSVLDAVQGFELDGDPIGLLAVRGVALRFNHPVAVRVNAETPGLVAVIEAAPARLRLLRLQGPLPRARAPSLLRVSLVEADANPAGTDGNACLQCHDGLVLDGREVWDPGREFHPRNIVPVEAVPEFFPLDEEGKIVCITCHSPHGVADDAEAEAAPQVRHQSPASPFLRLGKEADALCLACHTETEHTSAAGTALVPAGADGHPTGAAMVKALKARAKTGDGPDDPTKASCLSCHAMHGATGDHMTRDANDGTTCLGCHPAMARESSNHPLGTGAGRDLEGQGQHVVLSASGGVGCLSCHDLGASASTGLLRTLDNGAAVCLDCHDERKDLHGGLHAKLAKGGAPTCTACHDVHGGQLEARFLSSTAVSKGDPTGCAACHAPGKRGAKAGTKPGSAGHPVDGRPLELAPGEPEAALTCLTCHEAHAANVPKVESCESCHDEAAKARSRGGHGSATCLDCHPVHAHEPVVPAAIARANNPASNRCLACHAPGTPDADAQKLEAWEHPSPVFLPDGERWTPLEGLTLYTPQGAPVAAGENGDLACETCHLVHGPEASGADHLRKGGTWKAACSACHGDEALGMYRYYHQPARRTDLGGAKP